MKGYIKGNIDLNFNLGALAAADLLSQATQDAVSERARITSVDCSYALSNMTPGADIGPLILGVCHSDYTDAEVEEWVELATGWDVADLQSREVSSRLIRRIGTFPNPADASDVAVLNEGRNIKTRLNWLLNTGQNIRFWVYNTGTQPLGTTTPDISVAGHANLFTK